MSKVLAAIVIVNSSFGHSTALLLFGFLLFYLTLLVDFCIMSFTLSGLHSAEKQLYRFQHFFIFPSMLTFLL